MAERFKYGPLIYDTVDDVEDIDGGGNYWWAGLHPVGYDEMGIPVDSQGLQCLPLSSPFHPDHIPKDPVYNQYINDYVPSIKESIDIESRKFKISNGSLNISNIEYEGQRFTDILSETSLINWLVSIQFVSPSAKLFSTIYSVR